MFYTAFKLRSWTKPCIPKGPSYKSAKKNTISLSGTKLTLSYPRFRTKPHVEVVSPKKQYDLNSLGMIPYSDSNKNWLSSSILKGIWTFNGPMFLGWMANVECYVTIVKRAKKKEASLFHPRAFESALLELLAIQYPDRDEELFDQQLYHTPVNWSPIENVRPPAVRFLAKSNRKLRPNTPDHHHLYMTIGNEFLLSICVYTWSEIKFVDGKRVKDNDYWLSPQPMDEFIEKLINSVTIELSSEANQQMIKAQEGLENTSLTEEFPPVNVIEYEKNIRLK